METNRRGFFATAASGLAWLMGVKTETPKNQYKRVYAVAGDIPEFEPPHPRDAFAIPKLGSTCSGEMLEEITYYPTDSRFQLWNILLTYSGGKTLRGIAKGETIGDLKRFIAIEVPDDKPKSRYGHFARRIKESNGNGAET